MKPATRPAASRPAERTVTVRLDDGDFAGWEATARADFAAKDLADLQSGDMERIIAVLQAIITDHNMPTLRDEIATDLGDVCPYDGLIAVSAEIFEAIGKLPNR